ncbi:uncharacterized protein LOC110895677 isoform X3 [Helianthus annuus]|uniref:uncharacterized protein LOC110895677 isoform X3 n=1 Tax=Helianthus annuus TaxID=4232 RepID=UPI000B8F583A|nr:uncharacterized protein LOC110895677 isoform X3 [Helianthus annuus]
MTPSFTSENSKVPDLFYFVDEFKLIFKFLLNSYDVFLNFNTGRTSRNRVLTPLDKEHDTNVLKLYFCLGFASFC